MIQEKNIVLCDFTPPINWAFLKGLENNGVIKWNLIVKETNQYHGSLLRNLIRFFYYFLFPLQILCKTKCSNIVAWQQFYGLNYAFWMRILRKKKKQKLVVMTFIYKEKQGIFGLLYEKYMSYILKSGYIDKIICFSRKEVKYYSKLFDIRNDLFCYIPLGIETVQHLHVDNKLKNEKYIFSTGRSNRDYNFLISTLNNTKYKVRIACDSFNVNKSPNIIVDTKCYGEQMLYYMNNCYCVVVALKDNRVSSGQLVILQAMQLGKPVIISRSDGIEDYVVDGQNGFIIDNTPYDLNRALQLLYNDEELYNEMCHNAYDTFRKYYTLDRMGTNVWHIIKDLVGKEDEDITNHDIS